MDISRGYEPRNSSFSQLRPCRSGTLFSARQATEQARQAMHLRESITIAYRFLVAIAYTFLTFTKVSWKAPPPETWSQAVSIISASQPPDFGPDASRCHCERLPYP
jgi:hypothetical protein